MPAKFFGTLICIFVTTVTDCGKKAQNLGN